MVGWSDEMGLLPTSLRRLDGGNPLQGKGSANLSNLPTSKEDLSIERGLRGKRSYRGEGWVVGRSTVALGSAARVDLLTYFPTRPWKS